MNAVLQHIQQFVSSRLLGQAPTSEDGGMMFPVYSYGQQNSSLAVEEIQPIIQWVSSRIYLGTGYTGKSHLFWLLPNDDFRADLQRIYQKGDVILGYQCGDLMAPAPEGFGWRILAEHPSTRIYQLEEQEVDKS